MGRIFSKEQLKAITTRDKSLLVSAAAGSGKTTVLTERIIRSLLADEGRESLENMLIVTFTNASVADLRDKISAALTGAIRENPEDKRLERELFYLPSARICTIDSFCNEVLRSNADKVGINPSYRLAETAEAAILSGSLLDGLISSALEGELEGILPEEFEELCDCLTGAKETARLAEIFLALYERSKSEIEGVGIFRNLTDRYLRHTGEFKIEETEYGAYVMERLREAAAHYRPLLVSLIDNCDTGNASEAKYRDTLLLDLSLFDNLYSLKEYESAHKLLKELKLEALPTVRGEKTPHQLLVREAREEMKDALYALRDDMFSYTASEWRTLYARLGRTLTVLCDFLECFDGIYAEEKRRRAMLEYSDIEKYAYRCLYENGKPSEVAEAYQKSFSSVYIDEYQDVNSLQDAIFAAVASPVSRFMVGDIKQSIYGFRSAKPDIFAKMKTEYPDVEAAEASDRATLFMSNNYRCDEGIIDFVNTVFDRAFGLVGKSIGYTDGDRLNYAKVYPEGKKPSYTPAKIFISAGVVKDENGKKLNTVPTLVAKRIKSLLKEGRLASGEPIAPSDVAIIVRTRAKIADYAAALAAEGISADTADDKSFFLNREVLVALCLLNAVDNPKKDIYLAGLMCSPLYGFSPDELVIYRKHTRTGTLYDAITAFSAEHPDDKKLSEFLFMLRRFRTLAEGANVDDLISGLYRETGLLALASKHGGKDNLLLLYNYARKYEGSSYKGLYNFISYLNNIIDMGHSFDEKKESVETNAVKIVTAHSSKGLEYPVVFLDAGYELINLDARERLAYSGGFGLAVSLRAKGGLALVDNPVRSIVRDHMNRRFFEEELRVLYVALTRAREQLFVVGSCEDEEKLKKQTELHRLTLSEFSLRRMKSYLEIILATANESEPVFCPAVEENAATEGENGTRVKENQGESSEINAHSTKGTEPQGSEDTSDKQAAVGVAENVTEEQKEQSLEEKERRLTLKEELKNRFNFAYDFPDSTTLPEKMSVSRLHPQVLDGTEGVELTESTEKKESRLGYLPSFISGTGNDESARRGIVTHTFLQFCDFERLLTLGTAKELERLINEGYISKENESRVRINEIELFRRSELLHQIRSAKRLYREFRFNCFLPAARFTTQGDKKEALKEEKILVQGVIDCIVEDSSGNLHLIDYKTDRLTHGELSSKPLAEKKLSDKHSLQLYYYGLATKEIFGKAPATIRVYSLPLGDTVNMEKPKDL